MRKKSGPPWNIECDIERIGEDYLCRIGGGDRHIGAIALSQWRSDRATTDCLAAVGHKERGIATFASHTLCAATRKTVTCVAGLHYDSLDADSIDEIVQTAHNLTRSAARDLEQQRLEQALADPTGIFSRIQSNTKELSREIESFLSRPLDQAIATTRSRVATTLADNFDNSVQLFAPLYLGSACSNDCAYCGFRITAKFGRTHLSVDLAVQEARFLATAGHRTIDLVTGEIATDRFVDHVCKATRAILEQSDIQRINLNMGSLTTEQYRSLRSAGAVGYHLYQETYAPETYFEVHRSGLKRDMAYRLAGPWRAAEAGFEAIGMGILLGLHSLREDLAALTAHARLLLEDYPALQLGFSLPRLQDVDSDCDYRAEAPVDDELFSKAMLFLRLGFPAAHLTVTTRERPELRNGIMNLGATKFSAGVSTAPGGYTVDRPGAVQFDIADRRSLDEIAALIQCSGRTVSYE